MRLRGRARVSGSDVVSMPTLARCPTLRLPGRVWRLRLPLESGADHDPVGGGMSASTLPELRPWSQRSTPVPTLRHQVGPCESPTHAAMGTGGGGGVLAARAGIATRGVTGPRAPVTFGDINITVTDSQNPQQTAKGRTG